MDLTLRRPHPQRAERGEDVPGRADDRERRDALTRVGVDPRDRSRAVVRVHDPHPVVRGRDFRGRVADGDRRTELERGWVDDADGVRRRNERIARPERQREHGRDRGEHEQRHARVEQPTAYAATATPDRERGRPEAERRARVVHERVAALVAILRLFRESAREYRLELVVCRKRGRLLLHVRPEGLRLRLAPEGRRAGKELVEHAGERVLVGATVDLAATDLLRSEVVERSREVPGGGRATRTELRGQAEVGQVAVVGRVDENVRGLDVTVDETAGVRRVERVRDLAHEPESALGRKRPRQEERSEIGAVDEAGREVDLAVDLAGGVDGDDARVVDRGREPRLAQEALPERRVAGELRRNQLQCDGPVESELGRSVHHAHPAAAEHALDPVAGELRSYFGRHVSPRLSGVRSTK